MTIGEIIKNYCHSNGITIREFARRCEFSHSYISQLTRGRNYKTGEPIAPKLETYQKIADTMGMSLEDLFESMDNAPISLKKRNDNIEILKPGALKRHKIPMIGAVAGGQPIYGDEVDVIVTGPMKADCAVRLKGDSMEPAYRDGDIVFVHEQPDVMDGQIAVVFLDDESVLKRVYHAKNGLQLLSDNPKYKPINATFDEYTSIRILGVPCGLTRLNI